jgi:hypothetical protein
MVGRNLSLRMLLQKLERVLKFERQRRNAVAVVVGFEMTKKWRLVAELQKILPAYQHLLCKEES